MLKSLLVYRVQMLVLQRLRRVVLRQQHLVLLLFVTLFHV